MIVGVVYACAEALGIVWLVALQTRLRTLIEYHIESRNTGIPYFRLLLRKRFEWLYIPINLIVVALLYGFLRDMVTFSSSTSTRSAITVFGLSWASALFAMVIYPTAAAEAPYKRSVVLVIASTLLCFCVSVVLALALFASLVSAPARNLSSFDFLSNALSAWPFTGGPLSLLMAIIAVPLIGPIVAAVESVLGIKSE